MTFFELRLRVHSHCCVFILKVMCWGTGMACKSSVSRLWTKPIRVRVRYVRVRVRVRIRRSLRV